MPASSSVKWATAAHLREDRIERDDDESHQPTVGHQVQWFMVIPIALLITNNNSHKKRPRIQSNDMDY